MLKTLLSVAVATFIAFWVTAVYSQNAPETLICKDIGNFSQYKCECRAGRGILVTADHFGEDHIDVTCDVMYYSRAQGMTVKAEVTNHADPPHAIKWLAHEVDKEFRTYYGAPPPEYIIKNIDGQTLYARGSKGWNYRWISGNKVIMLEYHDSDMKKPEPMEVVKAYLAKHPSSLPAMTTQELRSASQETKWVKDEMDRRLLMCDRWLQHLSNRKTGDRQVREEPVESMNIFLDYRQKYFGVNAGDDKVLLANYLNSNNSAGIKSKLTEYREWWAANKSRAIRI